jgi:stage III sporulation protein AB
VTRAIGAVLLVAGTTSWGVLGAMKLRNKCRSLAAILWSLGALESEICDRLTPMPELITRLARECEPPARAFYANVAKRLDMLGNIEFSALWRRALGETPELLLNEGEAAVINGLSLVLGRYDAEEQRGAIAYARRRFEDFQRRAETARDTDSRLRAFLGVAAGLFAALILI